MIFLSQSSEYLYQKAKCCFMSVCACLLFLFASLNSVTADEKPHEWRGPYLGVTAGASATGANIDDASNSNDYDMNDNAISFGIVGGYNFSPFAISKAGQWIIGIEGDLQNINSNATTTNAAIGTAKMKGAWVASTRARAGYAWQQYHLYTTAGLAFSDLHIETASNKGDSFNMGIALGLGGEMIFSENWTGRAEALFYGFGEEDRQISGANHDIGFGASTLRLGIVRRF